MTRGLGGALLLLCVELVVSSCGSSGCGCQGNRASPTLVLPHASSPRSSDPAAEARPPNAPASATADPERDWREAARLNHWERAYQLLGELPADERAKPTTRLALGVAALALGHHAEAASTLAGLEEKLPLVREEIRAWYALAAAVAGPHEQAAAILLGSPKLNDLLEAARAYLRAEKLALARTTADRAVRLADRARREAFEARRLRAEIAEKAGDQATAVADLSWAIKNHPERAKDALAALDRLGATCSFEQRLAVLERSVKQGHADLALGAMDELAKKHPAQAATIALARGKALYRAREYARAVGELDRASARLGGVAAAEAKYYAARAAARSGQEQAAADRFGDLFERQGRAGFGERAALRQAELLLQLGRYRDAAKAFAQYASSFKKDADSNTQYGRALALLGADEPKKARVLLRGLRQRASSKQAGILQQLEGLAAERSGDREGAVRLWLALLSEQPLTWAALTARARLQAIGYTPLPAPIGEPSTAPALPLSVALPAAPALLSSLGLDAAAEKRLATMEDEAAHAYPGRESEALCQLYAKLAPARRRGQIGERAASWKLLMRAPNDAERWAWQCVYPNAYGALVAQAEQEFALPRGLVHAVIRQESAFEPSAVSPVGARGLMQLMPFTATRAAEELGLTHSAEAVIRPDVNIRLGAFYLGKLLHSFAGNLPLAVAAYNAGPHAVHSWLATARDREADLWVARIPYRETRDYVAAVLGNLARYQFLAGGSAAVTPIGLELPETAKKSDGDY